MPKLHSLFFIIILTFFDFKFKSELNQKSII